MIRSIFSVALFMLAGCCLGLYGQNNAVCSQLAKSSHCASKMKVRAAGNSLEAVELTNAETPAQCQGLKTGSVKARLVGNEEGTTTVNCDPSDCDPSQCKPEDCDPAKCDPAKCAGKSNSAGLLMKQSDCIPGQCKLKKASLALSAKL